MSIMSEDARSRVSNKTQLALEEVAAKTTSKIYSLEGFFNDQEVRVVWNAFGLYLSRNLRMGRAIVVPKLGIFTFTAPQVNLTGVTNPEDRNRLPRCPVFIVSKEFVKGKVFQTGIYYRQDFGKGARPFAVHGVNGQVPQTKLNSIQIASYANMDKEKTVLVLNRIVKHLSQKAMRSTGFDMEIPNVGIMNLRGNTISVAFNEFITRDTRNVVSMSTQIKKRKGEFKLTKDNLLRLSGLQQMKKSFAKHPDNLKIDEGAKRFLSSEMGIFLNENTDLKRTITNVDRDAAYRPYSSEFSDKRYASSTFDRLRKSGLTNFSMSQTKRQLRLQFNFAFRNLCSWLRDRSLSSEEGFLQFCRHCKNVVSKTLLLNEDDVWVAMKCISPDITEQQSLQLFRLLDYNKDGVVGLGDWQKVINHQNSSYLSKLYEVCSNLNQIQFLRRLSIPQGQTRITKIQLIDGLTSLLPSLSKRDLYDLSKKLLGDKEYINTDQLMDDLGIYNQQTKSIKNTTNSLLISRLKKHLQSIGSDVFSFIKEIRQLDSKGSGQIQQKSFKTLIERINFTCSVGQRINLINSLNPSKGKMRYEPLIRMLQEQSELEQGELTDFNQKVYQFLANSQKLKKNMPISVFASQLSHLFPKVSLLKIQQKVRTLDIDKDGVLSSQDLQAFVARRRYLQQTNSLFPVRDKSQNQSIEKLMSDLRQSIARKNYSFYDFFNMLDNNKDGFVTIDEINHGIDKVLKLQQAQKDQIFAYLDRHSNGMVDYKTFLEQMGGKKSNSGQEEVFKWAEDVANKIRKWYFQSGLQVDQAFKVMDKDFDGTLGQNDLQNFLIKHLGISQRDLTTMRKARLCKLLDVFKRDRIDIADFKNLVDKSADARSATVTGGKFLDSSQSWLANARQQIGLVLSRYFESPAAAFVALSKNNKKLNFENFNEFIDKNKALHGFFQNTQMRQKIFAQLDPHKKGSLSQNDFILAFGGYNWRNQLLEEVQAYIRSNFKNSTEAYNFFVKFKVQELTKEVFTAGIQNLLPKRFSQTDFNIIWNKCSNGATHLSKSAFNAIFQKKQGNHGDLFKEDYPRDDWQYTSFNIIKGTVPRTMQHFYRDNQKIGEICDKMVSQVKEILRASPKSLEQAFAEVDHSKQGLVTNLEFKKAFRILGIALTSKEIDMLLNYCDFKIDKLINWKAFSKKFNLDKLHQCIWEQAKDRLQLLSDKLFFHMISPNDAFRKYNDPRTGFMNFEQFFKMFEELSKLSKSDLPSHAIMKSIFEEIDIRKDNKIDHQEMIETFKHFNPPSTIKGSNLLSVQRKENIVKNNFDSLKQEYDLIKLVGRNRKFLLQEFIKLSGKNNTLLKNEQVVDTIKTLCQQHRLDHRPELYLQQVAFAQRDGLVDYRMLLDIFKSRMERIEQFPKTRVF